MKYSLSNMSVARRRRGWPAWGSSLSNGTGARIQTPQRLWAPNSLVRRGRRPRTRRTFLLKGLPSEPACLGRTAAPRPPPGVLQGFLPPTQGACGTASSPGLLWGKESEKAGRMRKVAEALGRPGWASPPPSPSSGSVRPESWEESPGRRQQVGSPPEEHRSGQHWAGRMQTRAGVLRSSTKP